MNKNIFLTIDQVKEFYAFLQGEIPEGYFFPDPIKLTPKESSSIIFYLQERYGIIPDNFESCQECEEYFDSYCEGVTTKEGHVCESCRELYEYCPECEEHFKSSKKVEDTFFVLSPEAAEEQGMLPGLYAAKRFPVYSSNMFRQNIYKDSVKLIKESTTNKETGFLCLECKDKILQSVEDE